MEVGIYELKKGNFSVKFTNYGAAMLSLILPNKHGDLADVVLGHDTIDKYKNDSTYFGAIVGMVQIESLVANEGNNTLHSGLIGFSDVIWTMNSYSEKSHVTFGYESYDGEQGFPGDLSVYATYMIIETNKLLSLALHTYWNLGSHNSGDILSHTIQLFGSKITQVDEHLIPTGNILNIEESPYDFLQPRQIGSRIHELPHGYDINYGKTGRKMVLWGNQPEVQFYTANHQENEKGKGGFVYSSHAGLCLETQGFPDSVNHPNFPS
ncbi:hypothetical protein ACJRO7_008154 [Eucalyptus globulus]|uniref:Uncharacterized protein n=1 Tax=Eucalyptus globulus TaxID=34317 RepID=A0ABD3IQK6_EUCGL